MKRPWAARLPAADEAACAHLRLRADVEFARDADTLWLRGAVLDEELAVALRKIPGLYRFDRIDDRHLVPVGCTVPVASVPAAEWVGAEHFFSIRLPPTRLPGTTSGQVTIDIVRSGLERPTEALCVDFAALQRWVEIAPDHRLRCLSFALADDRTRAIVRGAPLPPLRGVALWFHDTLLLPCGFAMQPPVSPTVIAKVLRRTMQNSAKADDGLFVFSRDGSWRFVPDLAFVHCSRGAVRASAGEKPNA